MSETTTAENPLVATSVPASGSAAATAGSGLFSDAASTLTDAKNGDWVNLGLDAATDGMDLLGLAMDPLGTLASAGVGWLIEHISFLHDALDQLAGSPEEVTAEAQTWTNISERLTETGQQYTESAAKVAPSFTGDGGDAYQATAKSYADMLHAAAGHAKGAATAMQVAAALVGTERGLIRDMISSFVGELIVKALAALASSWCTFGGSIAALIADTVLEASALAERIGSKVAKVVQKLGELAEKAGKSKGAIEAAAKALGKVGKGAEKLADKGLNVATKLDSAAGRMKEAGRSLDGLTTAEKAREVWKQGGERAEAWHDAGRNLTHRGLDKLDDAREAVSPEGTRIHSTANRLDGFNHRFGEEGRGVLGRESWENTHSRGWERPSWNTADTVGVATEGRRQENEQLDRAAEAREHYEEEHKGEEGERGGE